MSKPGKSLKRLCKKLGVRLTVKRGKRECTKVLKFLKHNVNVSKKRKKLKEKEEEDLELLILKFQIQNYTII